MTNYGSPQSIRFFKWINRKPSQSGPNNQQSTAALAVGILNNSNSETKIVIGTDVAYGIIIYLEIREKEVNNQSRSNANNSNTSNVIAFPIRSREIETSSFDSVKNRVTSMLENRFEAKVSFFFSTVPGEKNDGVTYKFDIIDDTCRYKHMLMVPKNPLQLNEIEQIKEILINIFVPAARLDYQNSMLQRYEEHMGSVEATGTVGSTSDGVFQINERLETADSETYDQSMMSTDRKMDAPFHSLVLEGSNQERINRFAREIHEVTKNMAILPWQDIKEQISDTSDLAQLSTCTVLIENIRDLSLSEATIVWDYLKNYVEGPLVIIGVVGGLEAATEDLNFNPGFAADLSKFKLAIDRLPLTRIDVRDLLELFLEH